MFRLLFFFTVIALACLGAVPKVPVDNRYAVLIGIGTYPVSSGLEPLHARNDLLLFSQTLTQSGFQRSHIRLLCDQQATREAIHQVFDSLARNLPVGSRLVIHFSGHGLQLPDDNHDEDDQFDEAIFPYDGHLERTGTLIRDDELNLWLIKIRQRIGPEGHVLFLFDSCHSGSILREHKATASRGMPSPMLNVSVPAAETSGWFEMNTDKSTQRLGNYILLSATTDGQPSFECTDSKGQPFGPLTLAVCRSWNNKPKQTYRGFFQDVRHHMSRLAPYQLPTLEGNVDTPFLGFR